jgi:hypothetical protein
MKSKSMSCMAGLFLVYYFLTKNFIWNESRFLFIERLTKQQGWSLTLTVFSTILEAMEDTTCPSNILYVVFFKHKWQNNVLSTDVFLLIGLTFSCMLWTPRQTKLLAKTRH